MRWLVLGVLVGLVRVRMDRREGRNGDKKRIGPGITSFVCLVVYSSPARTYEIEDEMDRRAESKI